MYFVLLLQVLLSTYRHCPDALADYCVAFCFIRHHMDTHNRKIMGQPKLFSVSILNLFPKVVGWLGGSAHEHIGEVRRNWQLSTPKADI